MIVSSRASNPRYCLMCGELMIFDNDRVCGQCKNTKTQGTTYGEDVGLKQLDGQPVI